MSMLATPSRVIRPGDTVIVVEGARSLTFTRATPGATFNNKFGAFRHDDMIGQPYGSRLHSLHSQKVKDGKNKTKRKKRGRGGDTTLGFVTLLRPTPELWTLSLNHRTQILYFADIAAVVQRLELRRGDVVLESGTGSASLTHALARAVAGTGRVFSFEFNSHRVQAARVDLARSGFGTQHVLTQGEETPASTEETAQTAQEAGELSGEDGVAIVTQRDVIGTGFPAILRPGRNGVVASIGDESDEDITATVDAVFLDLPAPWCAIPSARRRLVPGGRLCSFSPCLEQVQRTCDSLRALGFWDIQIMETLTRGFQVSHPKMDAPQLDLSPQQDETCIPKQLELVDASSVLPSVTRAFPDMRGHTGYLVFARASLRPLAELEAHEKAENARSES
ncbi:MAG: hypothetical protein MHM6MM_003186 [Cercozoa sp. M6MM]